LTLKSSAKITIAPQNPLTLASDIFVGLRFKSLFFYFAIMTQTLWKSIVKLSANACAHYDQFIADWEISCVRELPLSSAEKLGRFPYGCIIRVSVKNSKAFFSQAQIDFHTIAFLSRFISLSHSSSFAGLFSAYS